MFILYILFYCCHPEKEALPWLPVILGLNNDGMGHQSLLRWPIYTPDIICIINDIFGISANIIIITLWGQFFGFWTFDLENYLEGDF